MTIKETIETPERIDVAIIGAGVIGLAIARALTLVGREVIVFETEPHTGRHTSSHNSEVIHSGIYYKTPLKAKLCVEGRTALYNYCANNDVFFNRLGKLIVASSEDEVSKLRVLMEQGKANGVDDLKWLDAGEVKGFEPSVNAVKGIFSPSTGIIDSEDLMRCLKRDALNNGANILTSTPVDGGEIKDNGIELILADSDRSQVLCDVVINCAGLFASKVARSIRGIPPKTIPQTYFAKGNYFTINDSPFTHLVYPLPAQGGLGIHATLDRLGNVRFGPDVQWVDSIDYGVDANRASSFYPAIRRYYPSLRDGTLQSGYAGIRPKITPQGGAESDFNICDRKIHGIDGLVNLYGIDSPGLTSSLALADYVSSLV